MGHRLCLLTYKFTRSPVYGYGVMVLKCFTNKIVCMPLQDTSSLKQS